LAGLLVLCETFSDMIHGKRQPSRPVDLPIKSAAALGVALAGAVVEETKGAYVEDMGRINIGCNLSEQPSSAVVLRVAQF
jgi:hypothetical protein